jgi:hypothetical protein
VDVSATSKLTPEQKGMRRSRKACLMRSSSDWMGRTEKLTPLMLWVSRHLPRFLD